ncbi:MAG: hypothetical protein AAF456_10860 [Planctomycetota bacterium]
MERHELFADGIGEISLVGGMVRMDLVSLVGSQNDKENQPHLEKTHRIVMPPDGFLRSFSSMENLVKQLIEAGLVKPRDGANDANSPVSADNNDSAAPAKSPNF